MQNSLRYIGEKILSTFLFRKLMLLFTAMEMTLTWIIHPEYCYRILWHLHEREK